MFKGGKLIMYKHFKTKFTEILDIKQYKGKWLCSKEKIEAFEPNLLYERFISNTENHRKGNVDMLI